MSSNKPHNWANGLHEGVVELSCAPIPICSLVKHLEQMQRPNQTNPRFQLPVLLPTHQQVLLLQLLVRLRKKAVDNQSWGLESVSMQWTWPLVANRLCRTTIGAQTPTKDNAPQRQLQLLRRRRHGRGLFACSVPDIRQSHSRVEYMSKIASSFEGCTFGGKLTSVVQLYGIGSWVCRFNEYSTNSSQPSLIGDFGNTWFFALSLTGKQLQTSAIVANRWNSMFLRDAQYAKRLGSSDLSPYSVQIAWLHHPNGLAASTDSLPQSQIRSMNVRVFFVVVFVQTMQCHSSLSNQTPAAFLLLHTTHRVSRERSSL